MIDAMDEEIVSILVSDASTSKAAIGRRVGLAPSAVAERIRHLESEGVLRGYHADVDPHAFGKRLLAFVFVTDAKPTRGFDTAGALAAVTGLEELHKITGDDCYVLKVRVADTDELNAILEREISPIDSVTSVRTTIVLRSVTERVPMADLTGAVGQAAV